jgi:hypothetical protein
LNWIHLAKDRDEWRALVNTVMNLYWKILEQLGDWRFLKKDSAP